MKKRKPQSPAAAPLAIPAAMPLQTVAGKRFLFGFQASRLDEDSVGHTAIMGRTGAGKTTLSDLYASLQLSDAEFRLVWGDDPGSAPDIDPSAKGGA